KDCDYYEKKMAREAALKSQRVVHANVWQATPAWTNTNRVNKANQFTPRPVQLLAKLLKLGKMGTAVKTSTGCVRRKVIPLSNTNSGPTPDSNVNVSRGSSTEAYGA
ncbi:hypothetical protein Tco_0135341, partial [Tanacetum coccineum]